MDIESYQPTDKAFSIGVDLHIPKLEKLKDYLYKNCENKFNFPPHLGITYTCIQEKNLDEVFNYSINYFKNIKAFKTDVSNVIYSEDSINKGNIMMQLNVTGNELAKMHKETLTYICKNYKGNTIRAKDYERIKQGNLDDKRKEYAIKYGFSHVLDLYKPHITIGTVPKKYVTKDLKEKIEKDLKGVAGGQVEIKYVHIIYHTNPVIQTESVQLKQVNLTLE